MYVVVCLYGDAGKFKKVTGFIKMVIGGAEKKAFVPISLVSSTTFGARATDTDSNVESRSHREINSGFNIKSRNQRTHLIKSQIKETSIFSSSIVFFLTSKEGDRALSCSEAKECMTILRYFTNIVLGLTSSLFRSIPAFGFSEFH